MKNEQLPLNTARTQWLLSALLYNPLSSLQKICARISFHLDFYLIISTASGELLSSSNHMQHMDTHGHTHTVWKVCVCMCVCVCVCKYVWFDFIVHTSSLITRQRAEQVNETLLTECPEPRTTHTHTHTHTTSTLMTSCLGLLSLFVLTCFWLIVSISQVICLSVYLSVCICLMLQPLHTILLSYILSIGK